MNKRTVFAFFTIAVFVLGSVLSLTGQPVAAQEHSPHFSVFIDSNHVIGWDWPIAVEITMEIDDPTTPQNPDYSETKYADEVPGDFNEVIFGPDEAFEMQVGNIVTLSGGGYTSDTIITYLYLGGVDMLYDRLWGQSDPNAVVTVKNFHNRDIVRWETADAAGYWEADFSDFGDQPGEQLLDDFGLGTRYMIFRDDGDGDKTQLRDWEMPHPDVEVRLTQNLLEGQDWPTGYPVNISIDDPHTGPGADYSSTISPQPCWYDADKGCFWLPLGGDYRLYSGDSVTLSNGFLTKAHTVSALQVSSFDYAADLVCGTAEAGFQVETRFQVDELFFQRYETTAGDGTWCADFSVPGDEQREQNTFDLLPFTEGTAHLRDADGDTTQLTFPYNLVVWLEGEGIDGSNWLAGSPVTLEIDDPLTPADPDYTDSAVPVEGPWFLTNVQFDLYGLFDIQPGHLVRIIQGNWLKELVVSGEIALTEINYLEDTVSGTAAPGAHILTIHGYGGAARVTNADASGEWSVDYGVPGSHIIENETIDLLPGHNVMAAESDDDADSTNVSRHIATPWIDAGKTHDDVVAVGFARAGTVTLLVDDPATPESPDYTTTQVVGDGTAPWNDQVSYQPIELPEWLDLRSGFIVAIGDIDVAKEVVLADQEITEVNLYSDTLAGTAAPGTELRILLFNEGVVVARRGAIAGIDGTWNASFAIPGTQDWEQDIADIHSGSQLTASTWDGDGDRTSVDWTYNQPPVIQSIQAPADPAPANTEIEVSAAFSDLDAGDAHSALWEWGDGTTADGMVDEGAGSVSGSHVYSQAGVYTLSLTICDAAGACDSSSYQYVVIYDPDGGFVTGGGWIDSPAGAYLPAPDLSGPAYFGFVAKYKKGATEPDGNTQFQFQVADLNFHSDAYQWLVIAGSKAMFKGSGSINGLGGYGFLISAVDGDLKMPAVSDCFRIKIWDSTSGAVVYDNQLGAEEDAEPTTQLAAGSIVIHKAK